MDRYSIQNNIYFQYNSNKNPSIIFVELDNLILKYLYKQRPLDNHDTIKGGKPDGRTCC